MAELHETLGLRLPDAIRDPYKATTDRLNRFILPKEGEKHKVIESDVRELGEQVKRFERFISGEAPREDFDRLVPYRFLADREYETGDYATASVYYEKSLIHNPNDLEVMRKLAFSYHWTGRDERAREVADRMIALDPSNFIGYQTKVVVSSHAVPAEDIALLTEALKYTSEKSHERASVLVGRSNSHLLASRWAEAITDAEEALKITPGSEAAVVNKAIALKNIGGVEDALAFIQENLPGIKNKYVRAGAFAVLGDKESMLKELRAAIKADSAHRVNAMVDPDFVDYRQDPDFRRVVLEK